MTYRDVYVGDLDDPDFHWDGGNWSGNEPKALSPFFPPTYGHGEDPFFAVIHRIADGRYEGKQVDWGAWVAKMKKQQIKDFLREFYMRDSDDSLPHLRAQLQEVLRCVESLDQERIYGLTASEL